MASRNTSPRLSARPNAKAVAGSVFDSRETPILAVARGVAYAALFVAAMEVAADFVRFGHSVTPIWIASAVLAWALLATPFRDWALLLGLAISAHVLRAVVVHEKPTTEVFYLLANIGSPLACAALLRGRGDVLTFENRTAVLRFLLIAGLAAPSVSVAAVVLGSYVDPVRFRLQDIGVWFLSDALSFVVFLPIIRSLSNGAWRDMLAPAIRFRAAIVMTLFVAIHTAAWFLPEGLRHNVFPTLLIPCMIFIVFELGVPGARAAIAISTLFLLAHALLEPARHGSEESTVEYLFSVQVYLAAMVVCILPLAAALNERQKLYDTATEALSDAQAAWGDLIAAEAHYRLVADNSSDLVMRIGLDGAIIFASPACSLICRNVHDLEQRDLTDLVPEEDQATVSVQLQNFIKAGMLDTPYTIHTRLLDADGGPRPFDVIVTLVASATGRRPEEFIAVLRQTPA